MSVVTCAALLAMNMNLMCVSAAILILTALYDRAGATEHPTDREKQREKERRNY